MQTIEWIQQFRTPVLDGFFTLLNYFDRTEFFVLLVIVIWLVYGWKAALRLFYVLLFSKFVNDSLKEFFAWPRPFHIDPSVGLVHVTGYGLPSGAAQTVILLSGLMITYWKNRWKWVIAPIYIALISFSRLYLGVHFPIDILGGWLVGLILWIMYVLIEPPLERVLSRQKPIALLCLSQMVPLFFLLWWHNPLAWGMCGIAMLFGLNLFVYSLLNLK